MKLLKWFFTSLEWFFRGAIVGLIFAIIFLVALAFVARWWREAAKIMGWL